MNSLLKPESILLFAAVLWGLGWMPLHHFADQGLSGMPVVLATYGLLCGLAIPVLVWQRRAWWSQRWGLFAIGVLGGFGTGGLVGALSEGDVVRVMLLFYLAPVWGLLGGWLALGEKLSAERLLALGLAMLGIALTLGLSRDTFKPLTAADWLALVAGFAFAMNNLVTRAADQVPLASKSVVAFLGSAAVGAVFCLLQDTPLPPMSLTLWGQVLLFGIFWLVAMATAQYGFSHVEIGRASVLVVMELVVAVLTSAWFGDRELGLREWCGGALVTLAAVLAARPPRVNSQKSCEASL
jgi:drug/metabolite transporter (DMT)-like permease